MTSPFDTAMLAEIGPLRDAGFALHWLHPREKRPIGDGWSEAPVLTAQQLRTSHRPGNNLGVRLGEPSMVADGYLHTLDLDIRIADLAGEAWARLRELLPNVDLDQLPCVASGSGGASRHLHLITGKPFRSKLLAHSEGKHRRADGRWSYDWEIELFGTSKQVALPPSIHPDTGKPYRWEREFDFALLDLGIEPFVASADIEALAVAEHATYEFETREPLTFTGDQLDRALSAIPVSDLHYDDWIRLGQALHHQFGGSDEGFDLWLAHTRRSTKFTGEKQVREMRRTKWKSFGRYRGKPVTMASIVEWAKDARVAALRASFDDEEEEEEEELGQEPQISAAPAPPAPTKELDPFDAIGTDAPPPDEVDAVDLDDLLGGDTASDTDDDDQDDDLDDIDAIGSNRPVKGQSRAVSGDWISLLDINEEGAIKPTLHNLRLIIENDQRTAGVMSLNEFTQDIVQRHEPGVRSMRRRSEAKPTLQLDSRTWKMRDPINGDFWTEDKDNAIRAVIEAPGTQGGYGIKVSDRDLRAAVDIAGRRNAFHPVREYLSGLDWDGVERVERLFIHYLGAPDDPYHRAVARLMLVAAVARVTEPGCKFDSAVILEGVQGKRKSTFISILAKDWFVELDGDVEDTKQMVEVLQGAWIAELNELGGIAKADVRHIKAFISRRSDKVRLAYAKRAEEYHRQSILVGSTNDDVYLRDQTGGRRFLPVRCNIPGEIDTDHLLLEVDQLWAEARHFYEQMRKEQPHGTLPLYISDPAAREIAERLQESRKVEATEDALAGRIEAWLNRPVVEGNIDTDFDDDGKPIMRNEVCLLQIWCECLGRDEGQYTGMWPAALGRSVRMIPGWSESTRRPRFGKYGQQRAFERDGWIADAVLPKGG